MHCRLQSERRRRKIDFHGTLASYLHYTLKHDVFVVDCDYQSSDMRAVEQTPVRCRPSRRKPPFPTVASSKTPGTEIRKARPPGDSHGLADFHLRCLIPCRRKMSGFSFRMEFIRPLFFLSRKLELFANLVLYSAYRITYHLVCHLGIDMSRSRVFVPQHF